MRGECATMDGQVHETNPIPGGDPKIDRAGKAAKSDYSPHPFFRQKIFRQKIFRQKIFRQKNSQKKIPAPIY